MLSKLRSHSPGSFILLPDIPEGDIPSLCYKRSEGLLSRVTRSELFRSREGSQHVNHWRGCGEVCGCYGWGFEWGVLEGWGRWGVGFRLGGLYQLKWSTEISGLRMGSVEEGEEEEGQSSERGYGSYTLSADVSESKSSTTSSSFSLRGHFAAPSSFFFSSSPLPLLSSSSASTLGGGRGGGGGGKDAFVAWPTHKHDFDLFGYGRSSIIWTLGNF